MTRNSHTGKRQKRSTGIRNLNTTKYFLIVTDTEETEKNYINGLKESLPDELQRRIKIEYRKAEDSSTIDKFAINIKNLKPYFNHKVWIIFDRDQVPEFDKIIKNAEKEGIDVALSNPCLEIWFSAYFENMRFLTESSDCIKNFKELFYKKTNHDYKKNDKEIYALLNKFGDEKEAMNRAERKREEHKQAGIKSPSKMCPSTKVDLLVKEIKKESEKE